MGEELKVNEIFFSLQGESTRAGFPAVLVRLTGCNLRCNYCDTSYAWEEGEPMTIEEIITKISSYGCKLVEITGGEPMMQSALPKLARELIDKGFTVMIETNGTVELSPLPEGVIKIVDSRASLIQMLIPIALEAVNEELQSEVSRLAGIRYGRSGGPLRRWHNPGSVCLGGQKVSVKVPRVRNGVDGREIPLQSYKALRDTGIIEDSALVMVLNGLSQRKYAKAA